jgi:SagB-type dehydrogenase family enzyme
MKYIMLFFIFFIFVCSVTISAEGAGMKTQEKIVSPEPRIKGVMSLEEAILKRRSVRSYAPKDLSLEQISQLLWATQGITETKRGFRAAPSAGALYPLEIYLMRKDGVFHYDVEDHSLTRVKTNDVRAHVVRAAWGQRFIEEAPVSVVICAVRSRVTQRYGDRGSRYVDIEVGHAAENLHLQAVALGLASVPIGAFTDKDVKKILGLSRDTDPIYIVPVGYVK